MRSTAISMVLGMCGVLSFGCAEVQKVEKEASSVAKQEEKNGDLNKATKAAEDKIEKKDPKADAKDPKADAKVDSKADAKGDAKPEAGGGDVEAGVKSAVGSHGVKVDVKGGEVKLSGNVSSAKDKSDVEAAVKKVKGVTKVSSEIKVGK